MIEFNASFNLLYSRPKQTATQYSINSSKMPICIAQSNRDPRPSHLPSEPVNLLFQRQVLFVVHLRTLIFHIKIISRMIKRAKPGKSKVVSSYLLSGVNIKKIIAEQKADSQQSNQHGEFNIIRIGKHPIFKIQPVEKEDNIVEPNLQSKSFKIRSFTKKLRDASEPPKVDSSCEIYEKIEFVRNLRAINNRIDGFNPSRLSHLDRGRKLNESVGGSANVNSKMRQIFKRETSMKCKIGSQIFVKEFYQFHSKVDQQLHLNFSNISTNKYREVGNKIHVVYNQDYRDSDSCTLLIVSVDALSVNKKKIFKTSISTHQQPIRSSEMNRNLWSQQTVELIKMIACQAQPQQNDFKLAFKVKDLASLQSLRYILEGISSNYFCIFFPISKYSEQWNLYLIDPLLNRTKDIVLLDAMQSFQVQFPIFGDGIRSIFIGAQNQNFLTLSRTIQALKLFLCNRIVRDQDILENSVEVDSGIRQRALPWADNAGYSKKFCQQSQPSPQLLNTSFNIREERIQINYRALQAYLDFVVESRQLRNKRSKRRVSKARRDSDIKRGALCQIQVNIPEFSISNDLLNNDIPGKNLHLDNLDDIYQNLIENFKHTISDRLKGINSTRTRNPEGGEKGEDIEEIMGYIRGYSLRNRSLGQNISQLVRKNSHILKQISQFVHSKQLIPIPQGPKPKKRQDPSSNNLILGEQFKTMEGKEVEVHPLQFRVYRIS